MPGRIQVKVPSPNGISAGQTATWKLPIGRRYHALQVEYSGITLAQMLDIRVKLNGEVIHSLNGTQRNTLNIYDGRATAAGILTLPFDRYNLYNQFGEELTAIQTASADPRTGLSINQFEVEIDIDAAATAPVMTMTATVSDNDKNKPGPGQILRTLRYPRNLAAGLVEIADLPKGTEGPKYQFLNRTFFFSANLTFLNIKRSGYDIFQRSKALNDRVQMDGVRVPQTGLFVFDPSEEGYDFEPTALIQENGLPFQDFRFALTLSSAENVIAVQEYIGSLNG